jgi:8-oxo-dGTP pyrophosphatase MutT (NUDIX family)
MINFQQDNKKFNYRISGILHREGKILFHKYVGGKSWLLPGGRAELMEDSRETLKREFQEELDCMVKVKSLKYVVENFFEYNKLDYHELEFIYHVELQEGTIPAGEFEIVEFGVTYIFKWIPIEDLGAESIKPTCLVQSLDDLLATDIQHFIHK